MNEISSVESECPPALSLYCTLCSDTTEVLSYATRDLPRPRHRHTMEQQEMMAGEREVSPCCVVRIH